MKILCYGDSNTYGFDPRSWFGSRYPADCRWVDIIARNLGCEAVNAGENGREIPRRPHQLEEFRQLLAAENPHRLIVMLGTNDLLRGDSPKDVALRMEAFLEQIPMERRNILLIGPPPMVLGEWVPTPQLTDASVRLNREYRALSQRLELPFADAGQWNVTLCFDGVHFTEEGHRAFAEGLTDFLNKGEPLCWK